MFDEGKKLLHETIVKRLNAITVEVITNRMMTGQEAVKAETLLGVLMDSKMPAEVAHDIAKKHEGLGSMYAQAGYARLAGLAERVLADLREREDEKKPEVAACPSESLPPGVTPESRKERTRDVCGNN